MIKEKRNIWKTIKRPILALAPMAGYTDPAFRVMCLKNKADVVYIEMVSVEALWRKNKKTLNMLKLLPDEKNVILQLGHPAVDSCAIGYYINDISGACFRCQNANKKPRKSQIAHEHGLVNAVGSASKRDKNGNASFMPLSLWWC